MRPAAKQDPALVAALTLAMALTLAGCAAAPVVHERTVALRAQDGGMAEVNVLMDANATVAWEWQVTGGTVLFNVHSHPQGPFGPVVEHVRNPGAVGGSGVFKAPAAGGYSLMWLAEDGAEPNLTYTLTGDARLDLDHPPTP